MIKLSIKKGKETINLDSSSMSLDNLGLSYYDTKTGRQMAVCYDEFDSWKAEGKITDSQRASAEKTHNRAQNTIKS